MIELRWVQVPHTTTEPPVLQFRQLSEPVRTSDAGYIRIWSDWETVPLHIEEKKP